MASSSSSISSQTSLPVEKPIIAHSAMTMVGALKPDIAVVDLGLKKSMGIELIKDLKVQHPSLPVLVLSMHDESLYTERALRAGARGYIMKDEPGEEILLAIRRVSSDRQGVCLKRCEGFWTCASGQIVGKPRSIVPSV